METKLEILNRVYRTLAVDDEVMHYIIKAHELVTFKKGEIILPKNKTMDCYYILSSGIARSFIYKHNRADITTDFYIAGDIIIDMVSLFQQTPSEVCIEAISDLVCFKIKFDEFQKLHLQYPSYSDWGRNWMTQAFFKLRQRAIKMATQPASSRYADIRKNLPEVYRDVPLKYIASYLGMTNTSLSRLRSQKINSTSTV